MTGSSDDGGHIGAQPVQRVGTDILHGVETSRARRAHGKVVARKRQRDRPSACRVCAHPQTAGGAPACITSLALGASLPPKPRRSTATTSYCPANSCVDNDGQQVGRGGVPSVSASRIQGRELSVPDTSCWQLSVCKFPRLPVAHLDLVAPGRPGLGEPVQKHEQRLPAAQPVGGGVQPGRGSAGGQWRGLYRGRVSST